MASVRVEPGVLDEASDAMSRCSERLTDESKALGSATNGSPWGADSAGKGFGQHYAKLRLHADYALASHAHVLASAGQMLHYWAENSRRVEERNVETQEDIARRLEEMGEI